MIPEVYPQLSDISLFRVGSISAPSVVSFPSELAFFGLLNLVFSRVKMRLRYHEIKNVRILPQKEDVSSSFANQIRSAGTIVGVFFFFKKVWCENLALRVAFIS